MEIIAELQKATLQARERTGNKGIGTKVRQGRISVIFYWYDMNTQKGKDKSLSGWISPTAAIEFLEAMS